MKTTFIPALGLAIMAATGLIATSCSNDDEPVSINYQDKSKGESAIKACTDLVSTLEAANREIGQARLSMEQEAYLKDVLANLVDNVIVPTYTRLADHTETLEQELNGLDVNTITQEDVNKACASFKQARRYWEQSEAFLGGAASDYGVDPTIDSWPLNRSLLLRYFQSGMTDEIKDDGSVLGFHALEFILFRNGKERNVAEFKGMDSYKGFAVAGEDELNYAQQVCKLLKERTFQLQVAWEGETDGNAARAAVAKAARLELTTEKGLSYGDNMKQAGTAQSTFGTLQEALAQVLSDDEGSAAAIANEVGTAKIANPFQNRDVSYVESPYSYNSIADFQDNIRSIRNVWYGTTDGTRPGQIKSFYTFFQSVSGSTFHTRVDQAVNEAIEKIGDMPAPFVQYCSSVWGIAFEDDNEWD